MMKRLNVLDNLTPDFGAFDKPARPTLTSKESMILGRQQTEMFVWKHFSSRKTVSVEIVMEVLSSEKDIQNLKDNILKSVYEYYDSFIDIYSVSEFTKELMSQIDDFFKSMKTGLKFESELDFTYSFQSGTLGLGEYLLNNDLSNFGMMKIENDFTQFVG